MEPSTVQDAIELAFSLARDRADQAMHDHRDDPRYAARLITAAFRRAEKIRDMFLSLEAE